ncbi:hypothetical protein A33Q_0684 [Indibacter alkaliphilus LW1]|uniref:Uncharacterized protein n=1 Tax=Indibacter alkaliphilus (strain CCUG 57479 / KCTC 22604 / LW1) TaxID=1189612 RepID=S2E423_INDAL|nr:hypothetical protein A33Q_0684 [Indibacter alkaliphilus LW1]
MVFLPQSFIISRLRFGGNIMDSGIKVFSLKSEAKIIKVGN